ncbi:diguanylate cyclase (GGDEF) domain-containing protein [Desulfosporosinus acidiphilus SJ4]|uniref:Diguanylate cyclase (GGDEF) domain-containing protein n=1 Tax=Desulfosporosinus acidiphilus (strain DSM 22704 / JCM 16185 / SJ4) TaxID=646529 RepID=I4D3B1_DESAJ|nr:diguanylate cyclase [Desulfosporosinus acidiphilus]AFM40285.1 diguanylate cyclase (GGDEF) domain-containing protein [Desulfosporosinus acidiphilus SJ4]
MIRELIINIAIIIATISIGNQILINKKITPFSPYKLQIFFGLCSALLGIILMLYSIIITPSVIMDLRNIAVMLSATYCGFLSAMITGIILSLFRLLFQGQTMDSFLAALNILTITVCCALTAKYMTRRRLQWVVMSIYTLIFPTLTFIHTINNKILLIQTVIFYWISTIIVSIVVYIYLHYIDLLRFTYQRYREESFRDHRTGLLSVRQFDKEFNKLIDNLSTYSIISMLFLDIDYFKKVNDVYGHQNGDKVLEDIGKILLSSTSSTDIVSRNGGEEFSVILIECPQNIVLEVAERIRKAVQDHKFSLLDNKTINITISIGVAIYPYTVKNIEMLVEQADSALYQAKRTGRNKVVLANYEQF